MKERVHEYFSGHEPEKLFRRMMALSVVLHAVVCGLLFSGSLSAGRAETSFLGRAVEVSLVDLPAPEPGSKPVSPVKAPPKPPPKAEAVEAAPAAKNVPPAPAKSSGRTVAPTTTKAPPDSLYLKRKAEEAERRKRLEQDVLGTGEAENSSRVSERDRLRAALAALKEEGMPEESKPNDAASSARSVEEIEQQIAAAARAKSALETADEVSLRREVEYRSHVIERMQRRWSVPANLSRRRELATVIRFRIDADGTVLSAKLEEGSGESAFDDAVLRAAREMKKLNAPPPEFPRNFLVKFNNTEG